MFKIGGVIFTNYLQKPYYEWGGIYMPVHNLYRRIRYNLKRKSRLRFLIKAVFTIFICSMLFRLLFNAVAPAVSEYSWTEAERIISDAVNNAVNDYFKTGDIILPDIKSGNSENIIIISDAERVNRINSELASFIHDRLANIDYGSIEIPAGSFLGNTLLAGQGICVKFRINASGSISAIVSTSINPIDSGVTKHSAEIIVLTHICLSTPLGTETRDMETRIPLGNTVIISNYSP